MATKLTFIGAKPAETTGTDVQNAGPQSVAVADQNLANLQAAVDDKSPLGGPGSTVDFSVGKLTAAGNILIKRTTDHAQSAYAALQIGDGSADNGIIIDCGTTHTARIFLGNGPVVRGESNGDFSIFTGGAERLRILAAGIPTYADNSAAASLAANSLYRTSTGQLMIKY